MSTMTSDATETTTGPGPETRTRPAIRASRAVLRDIEPGSLVDCVHCGERVKFQAKVRLKQVICNVYDNDRWVRVEHYHDACYDDAGAPHGAVDTTPPVRTRRSQAAAAAG